MLLLLLVLNYFPFPLPFPLGPPPPPPWTIGFCTGLIVHLLGGIDNNTYGLNFTNKPSNVEVAGSTKIQDDPLLNLSSVPGRVSIKRETGSLLKPGMFVPS